MLGIASTLRTNLPIGFQRTIPSQRTLLQRSKASSSLYTSSKRSYAKTVELSPEAPSSVLEKPVSPATEAMLNEIKSGSRRALSKAITMGMSLFLSCPYFYMPRISYFLRMICVPLKLTLFCP